MGIAVGIYEFECMCARMCVRGCGCACFLLCPYVLARMGAAEEGGGSRAHGSETGRPQVLLDLASLEELDAGRVALSPACSAVSSLLFLACMDQDRQTLGNRVCT